jgi:XTP/dITP diphosphohydrolase
MLRFVTTNEGKVREAREYLDGDIAQLDFDYREIQSDDLGEIAAQGAREAYRHAGEPVIVDDAGLFIEAFDGFPGPYSAYVEDTVGVEGVWEMAQRLEDRRAAFHGVVAYCDGDGFAATPEPIDRQERRGQDLAASERDAATTDEQVHDADGLPVKLFYGVVPGTLVAPRGDGGFGYDPIFEYNGTTFAEMDTERKNAISHRGRALAKFADWYAQREP